MINEVALCAARRAYYAEKDYDDAHPDNLAYTADPLRKGLEAYLQTLNQTPAPVAETIEEPLPGSQWIHHSGRIYTVLFLTNEQNGKPAYPRTVIYEGENGKRWSGLLHDWHRRMKPLADFHSGGIMTGPVELKGLKEEFPFTDEVRGIQFKDIRAEARMRGYTGDLCAECGNATMLRNGTCLKCDTCGSTTGCS